MLSWKNIDVNEHVLSRKTKMSMSMYCLENKDVNEHVLSRKTKMSVRNVLSRKNKDVNETVLS